MTNLDAIEQLIEYLNAAFPAIPTPAATIAVFADGLADLPGDILLAAARDHVRDCPYFPTVAELRRLAYRQMHPAEALRLIESGRLARHHHPLSLLEAN